MNVVVGQSGGPTSVINASLAGVYAAAVAAGADKVYGMRNGISGLLKERLVVLNDLLKGEKEIELLKRTPACYLGSCRYKLKSAEKCEEEYEKIFSAVVVVKSVADLYVVSELVFLEALFFKHFNLLF